MEPVIKRLIQDDGEEARKQLNDGLQLMAKIVGATLGPSGRNIMFEDNFNFIRSIRDGVTIIAETEIENSFQNAALKVLKECAKKTNEEAGDGTTTTAVLLAALVKNGVKNITSGSNPVLLKNGMDKAVKIVTSKFKEWSREVTTAEQIEQVATISTANDKETGKLIKRAFDIVGKDGVINIQEGHGNITELDITKGMEYENGLLSNYFITDPKRGETILEDPYILTVYNTVQFAHEIIPILEQVHKTGKPLVLIAKEVGKEALSALVINHVNGMVQAAAAKAPMFGRHQESALEDVAILTGSVLFSEKTGRDLRTVRLEELGRAQRVIITPNRTTIVVQETEELKKRVQDRIYEIDREIEDNEKRDIIKDIVDRIKERKARLSAGIAVIRVGAATKTERDDKKLRIEDAINAVRSAIGEGVVAGGGTAQAKAAEYLKNNLQDFEGDEKIGAEIVANSLQQLVVTISKNAGISGEVILKEVLQHEDPSIGYSPITKTFEDMHKIGVLDPVRVSRVSLENAVSSAGQILLSEGLIVLKIEDRQADPKYNPYM